MRSDVKVAMAIAVILIGIGVVWFVFYSSDASKDQKTDVKKTASPNGSDTNKVIAPKPKQKDPISPLTSGKPLITSPYGEKEKDSTKTTTGSKDATADSSDDGAGKTGDGDWSDVPDKSKRITPSYLSSWTKEGTTKTTGTTGTTGTTTARTYVVKDGDSYWSIAKNLWGDGLLNPHLQKAKHP